VTPLRIAMMSGCAEINVSAESGTKLFMKPTPYCGGDPRVFAAIEEPAAGPRKKRVALRYKNTGIKPSAWNL